MFNKTDIFFIVLFIIVITLIVGINISNLIDKKISDISVNIPKINIPKPVITLNISRDSKEMFMVCNENKENKDIDLAKKQSVKKIDDNIDYNKEKEKFTVADAQDIHNYDNLKKATVKKHNNTDFIDQEGVRGEDLYDHPKIIYPGKNEFKSQHDGITYAMTYDYGLEAPPYYVSCANSSIAQKWRTGKKSLLPNQIACNRPNKLTAENYYKKEYKIPIAPMEDYHIKGHNYSVYINKSNAYATDKRILSQSTKGLPRSEAVIRHLPHGYNYVFHHNTPQVGMP
uniref:Uncharacterized protein n=1 Tax=Mimivirus LCMiAC01 TaxID=2506608 RepID=A0A481YZT9_9VIRU|nr:MAG: hypothetical protein LCMiAC01_04540 [Mimivirus LCMiAC01]